MAGACARDRDGIAPRSGLGLNRQFAPTVHDIAIQIDDQHLIRSQAPRPRCAAKTRGHEDMFASGGSSDDAHAQMPPQKVN